MLSNGLNINECYKCVYVKNTYKTYVIVCLYLDDILIFDNNTNIIKTVNQMLTSKFNMKDMGIAYVILGIRVSKTHDGLILSQCHYIKKKIIDKFKKIKQYSKDIN